MSEEPLTVEVDPRSPVPPYEQIRTRLLELVRTGALAPGTRLPPIRQLAGDLGVAPNTVARAYRELEAAGVLSSRRRHGTTVTPEAAERARPGVARGGAPVGGAGGPTLEAAARAYLEQARRLGRTLDEAVEELRRIGGE
ncbi:GntR family transcriptional regulator [Nocardiopsis composta]|uniref:DNA-binding transcriptional regulator YhcF (GntR family) n=1 Tax=Nocardiopsis composta TaxID=157465 RepID=A0A7W8VFT4_9ACTN|nr:GntR family transcriptional regulator [Nocardiopsis composta]MBB5434455.1 DNA-binding transcriptional regulator YhcF (GntR family) [Nocardiopsis composta]